MGESADTPPLQGWGSGSGGADYFTLFQQFNRLNQHVFTGVGQPASSTGDGEWTGVGGSPPLALHPWYAAYMTYRAWTQQQQRSVGECFTACLGHVYERAGVFH